MTTTTYAQPAPLPNQPGTLHHYTRPKPQSGERETDEPEDRSLAPAVLTIREACAVLKISKWTLYRLIHSRQLKTIKIGSRRLVPVESVSRFIDQLREDHT